MKHWFCIVGLIFLFTFSVCAQELKFTSIPPGYIPGSIPLSSNFAGGMGIDPVNDKHLFVSVGAYLNNRIAKVNLSTASVTLVAEGPFGNIAGIVVISATQLVLIDNAAAEGGPPDKTILLATDQNQDGDFNDTEEIKELMAPILTGLFGWSGAQARLVPPGNPFGLSSGSLIVQTADGGKTGELLVIADPLGTPSYRPEGGSFFNGFDYNGGFDFDSQGHLLVGSATVVDPTMFVISGKVFGLVNKNQNEVIEEDEWNTIVDTNQLPAGISDLIIDREDQVYCTSGGKVFTFPAPSDPLIQGATVTEFANTNSFFLSGIMLNTKQHPFEPFSGPHGAILVIGGGFGEKNLLTLTPSPSADLNDDGKVDSEDLLILQEQWMK
jgi:hypothetical protein